MSCVNVLPNGKFRVISTVVGIFSSTSGHITNLIILSISLYFYNDCNKNHSFEFVPAVLFPFLYLIYHAFAHQRCIKNTPEVTTPEVNNQQGGSIYSDTISSMGY